MTNLIAQQGITLNSPQKAAVILVSLGPASSQEIVSKIDDKDMRSFITALESLKEVPRETLLSAIAEFITILDRKRGTFRAGPGRAREMAESILDSDRVSRILGAKPKPKVGSDPTELIWTEFAKSPVEEISGFVSQQRNEVGVLILRELPIDIAGEVLGEMDDEVSATYVSQLSKESVATDRARQAVARLVEMQFLDIKQGGSDDGALNYVADLLGTVSKEKRDSVLSKMDQTNPEQAKKIRQGMLTFEDLPARLPPSAITIIFKELDKINIMRALKAGGEYASETTEFLLGNISQRMADALREEIEEMEVFSPKEGDRAVATLMGFVGKLEREGRVTLAKKQVEESFS
jgi:flagellar motor switch protein FliG